MIATIAALLLLLAGGWLAVSGSGALHRLDNSQALATWVAGHGIWGPLLIIGLMTAAIVFSPLPSAPIALASGALFGHGWGTLYVVIGAELGALIAFTLARSVGYPLLRRWLGAGLDQMLLANPTETDTRLSRMFKRLGSQNGLMAVVLGSRMMPFLSFDLVSYAAGLTPLSVPRFALATLIGVIPISFLLAHFGAEVTMAAPRHLATAALLLGVATVVPLFGRWLWLRWRAPQSDIQPTAPMSTRNQPPTAIENHDE